MPHPTASAQSSASQTRVMLDTWSCLGKAPGVITIPDLLVAGDHGWIAAKAPGTVAEALNHAGQWDFDHPTDLDAFDWWYRTTFAIDGHAEDLPCQLCFDGLATYAEVYLNGHHILATDNSFRSYRVDVETHLQADNELVLVFRSLAQKLKQKRPRPRWKTNLVREQQLRWNRASLLGRIPGWAPCAPTIGPWREVRVERSAVLLERVQLIPTVSKDTGRVEVNIQVAAIAAPHAARLRVGDWEGDLIVEAADDDWRLTGSVVCPEVPRWFPHTHGEPRLHACELIVELDDDEFRFALNPVGFRSVDVQLGDGFAISVNDLPVFCRGACWTVHDLLRPQGNEAALRRDLQLLQAAGANMLRVAGTMNYESDDFYRICDELGLLVWQDFMFANMDYPVEDAIFNANITREATEQLDRLAPHPAVVVYCGSSEIQQQAAMLGLPRDNWSNDWFERQLPALCAAHHPSTGYVPSTPTAGALPFHTNVGLTHYYGVGAYLRSPAELRQADVRFTPECLGFANLPEPATAYAVTGGARPVFHDPQWKRRVPRDSGAGWDFEDVRDHYLRETHGVDPVALRSFDPQRYWELSRVVSGEMMARVFAEWRSTHSHNRGGLIWFAKDLWPGAGWGILDSNGLPKAAYYFLKRLWQPQQLTITDEGLNGLDLHLTNETSSPVIGSLELLLLKEPNIVVARTETPVQVESRGQLRLQADALLGRFYDTAYAYRFGARQHDLVAAVWHDECGQVVSEAVHFLHRNRERNVTPQAIQATASAEGGFHVSLRTDAMLHGVRLEADGYLPEDNYFPLLPQRERTVFFSPVDHALPVFRPVLEALNLSGDVVISNSSAAV